MQNRNVCLHQQPILLGLLYKTEERQKVRRVAEMEFEAAVEYRRMKDVNYMPCGLVIHPDALWLGASPDGLTSVQFAQPKLELVEIKYPNMKNSVDCKYLWMQYGTLALSQSIGVGAGLIVGDLWPAVM